MNYEIEYEIPPMRAIYAAVVEDVRDMAHARVFVEENNPRWKIRKIRKAYCGVPTAVIEKEKSE